MGLRDAHPHSWWACSDHSPSSSTSPSTNTWGDLVPPSRQTLPSPTEWTPDWRCTHRSKPRPGHTAVASNAWPPESRLHGLYSVRHRDPKLTKHRIAAAALPTSCLPANRRRHRWPSIMPVRRWSSHGPASQTTSPAKPNRTTRTPVGRSAGSPSGNTANPPGPSARRSSSFSFRTPSSESKRPRELGPPWSGWRHRGRPFVPEGQFHRERSSQPQPRASRDPVSTPTTCEARRCHC